VGVSFVSGRDRQIVRIFASAASKGFKAPLVLDDGRRVLRVLDGFLVRSVHP
jgi:hypothetical protein